VPGFKANLLSMPSKQIYARKRPGITPLTPVVERNIQALLAKRRVDTLFITMGNL
jgi:hypothetical protein